MPRWALICLTKTGIRAARITSTRPMMDRVQVQPFAAGIPRKLSPSWKPTMMIDTSHLNGNMIVSKKSIRYPYSSGRRAAFFISLSSQELVRVVQYNNCGRPAFRPMTMAGGDMVHSTGIPRVAFGEPFGCEPAALHGAMHRDRLQRIGRTRREETAYLTVQGRNHLAVGLQQENEDVPWQVPHKPADCGQPGLEREPRSRGRRRKERRRHYGYARGVPSVVVPLRSCEALRGAEPLNRFVVTANAAL